MRSIVNSLISNNEKKQYLRTGILFLLAILIMCFYEEVFGQETVKETMAALSNAFFVPGALFFGFGVLGWVASDGMFDMFSYAVSRFSLHHIIPGMPQKEKCESFYEYKQVKAEKRKKWNPVLLIAGLVGIVIGIIFTILFSNME